jgi:hypothetical protein
MTNTVKRAQFDGLTARQAADAYAALRAAGFYEYRGITYKIAMGPNPNGSKQRCWHGEIAYRHKAVIMPGGYLPKRWGGAHVPPHNVCNNEGLANTSKVRLVEEIKSRICCYLSEIGKEDARLAKKLSLMTEAKGCTPAEAATARAMLDKGAGLRLKAKGKS